MLTMRAESNSFEHLSLSYNGGKDCLVLLLIYLAVLHTHFTRPSSRRKENDSQFPTSIPSIYATPPDPFPAVTTFVSASSSAYHLSLIHIRTNPPPPDPQHTHTNPNSAPPHPHLPGVPVRTFRDAFALYLQHNPTIQAIFVGTRRTDPHGEYLTPFQRTDGNWPDFMRVHPVLDWKLSEIWAFLRFPGMVGSTGYCGMYDEGYTSLGGRGDTVRNPLLKVRDGEESGDSSGGGYRPAWTMVEDREERAGRE
jgi:FAD synthetase